MNWKNMRKEVVWELDKTMVLEGTSNERLNDIMDMIWKLHYYNLITWDEYKFCRDKARCWEHIGEDIIEIHTGKRVVWSGDPKETYKEFIERKEMEHNERM